MLTTRTPETYGIPTSRRGVKGRALRCLLTVALAFGLMGAITHAQTPNDKQPWQGTFTKTGFQPGSPRIFMDLPLPASGRVLTLERIGVILGPSGSIYTKLLRCEIESDRPKLENAEFLENRTRLLLPLPVHLGAGTNTWAIINAPIRIYAEDVGGMLRNGFRVACDVDAIGLTTPFTVTAIGYTTPK
jgi:hypothetical protein